MAVSKNRGTPKSSILIGCSIFILENVGLCFFLFFRLRERKYFPKMEKKIQDDYKSMVIMK